MRDATGAGSGARDVTKGTVGALALGDEVGGVDEGGAAVAGVGTGRDGGGGIS